MKKLLFIIIAVLLFSPFMLFSGGKTEAKTESAAKELTMWFGRKDFIPDDELKTFHRQNPDIRVNFDVIPLEQALSQFLSSYEAKRSPDIMQLSHDQMLVPVRQGMLKNINPLIERWKKEDSKGFAEISPFAFQLATWEGVTYGMTMYGSARCLVYRKDLFDKAGLSAPETWEDVLTAARKLRGPNMLGISIHGAKSVSPYAWFGTKFLAMGGEVVDGVPQLDSEAGIYLLNFYQTLVREKLVDPDVLALSSGDFRAAFLDGRAAMIWEAPNLYPSFQARLKYGEQWVVVPPPYRPGAADKVVIGGGGWPFYVSNQTKDTDAIYKLLRYLSESSHEVAIRYQPPTRTSILQRQDFIQKQPWWGALKSVQESMAMSPLHPRNPEISEVVNEAMQWALSNPNGDARAMAKILQQKLIAIHAKK
jgi:ABC-type glycerol-3-phosphate transport system substrate-binding protein